MALLQARADRGQRRRKIVLAFWFYLPAAVCLGQLPDESQLPGLPSLAVPLPTLPDESQLPGVERTSLAADEPTLQLPAESVLPAAQPPSHPPADPSSPLPPPDDPDRTPALPPGDEADRELLELDESPDQRPWLTLRIKSPLNLVRALAFSTDARQLFVAGDDKSVLVYRRDPAADAHGGADAAGSWRYERTLRWQIQRGPRGSIFALQPVGDSLVFGGYGAMGEMGEIVVADPATGKFRHVLRDFERGNRHRITSIASPADARGEALAAMDAAGKLVYWRQEPTTGAWNATVLASDAPTAVPLAAARTLHPIVMPDRDHVLAPLFSDTDRGFPRWKLQLIDVTTGRRRTIAVPDEFHHEMVTALASSADGSLWASADAQQQIFLWQQQEGRVTRFKLPALGRIVTGLSFSGDGKRLLAGTMRRRDGAAHEAAAAAAQLQLWDVSNPRRPRDMAQWPLDDDCFALAFSAGGQFAAASAGSQVTIYALNDAAAVTTRLQPEMLVPLRVAFPKSEPYYRIGLGSAKEVASEASEIEHYFDTQQVHLRRATQVDSADWLQADAHRGDWGLDTEEVPGGRFRYWLTRGGQRATQLPLDSARHGVVTSSCWLADAQGRPAAVALGTSGESNIYVFRLAGEGSGQLLRQFRGHNGAVVSIGCSQDRRYLVSSAKDAVICVWRWDGDTVLAEGNSRIDLWGADFAVEDDGLVVSDIRPDGPLYFRGLRQGDQIVRLQLPAEDAGTVRVTTVADPQEMLAALRQHPWDHMVAVHFHRGRTAEQAFQSFPAWQPIASLLLDRQREWAYWAPSGHYDASFEGHKLFGWQVNRGPETPPDFFLAAEVRATLERPRVMARLLQAGSLEEAFRLEELQPPANAQGALRDQYRLLPRVELLSPGDGATIDGRETTVRAAVWVPPGERLLPPKTFANGVVATAAQKVEEITQAEGTRVTYEWLARLPADRHVAIQVMAATESRLVGTSRIHVHRSAAPRPARPRLYVLAAGVDQYRDAQIPRLRTAALTARQIVDRLDRGAHALFHPQMMSLLDRHVTVPACRVALEQGVERLKESVSADDVLLIFLSGHGVKDRGSGRYYYLSSEARYADVIARRYADCLSFEDLALFADLPCRKLVILDTCHSGAVQPLRQSQLKSALRALQDDLVLTLTASEGDQEAVEGRFGGRLIEALGGKADGWGGAPDGKVSFAELAEYVRQTVRADSAEDAFEQVPTAGPQELLELVELFLTQPPDPTDGANSDADQQ